MVKDDSKDLYWCTTRWGRVGEPGATQTFGPFTTPAGAIAQFRSKFKDKTKNVWENRANFVKHSDKYDLVDQDYDDSPAGDASTSASSADASTSDPSTSAAPPSSKLPERVQRLIALISNKDMICRTMKEFEIDVAFSISFSTLVSS